MLNRCMHVQNIQYAHTQKKDKRPKEISTHKMLML